MASPFSLSGAMCEGTVWNKSHLIWKVGLISQRSEKSQMRGNDSIFFIMVFRLFILNLTVSGLVIWGVLLWASTAMATEIKPESPKAGA